MFILQANRPITSIEVEAFKRKRISQTLFVNAVRVEIVHVTDSSHFWSTVLDVGIQITCGPTHSFSHNFAVNVFERGTWK
jgi:hypothetical protein